MNSDYSNCLSKGVQEIIHIIAVPNIDDGEKKTVITVFSKALTESICNPSRISNCDFLIQTASMRHIDAKITGVFQKRQASAKEIEATLALCERQTANIQMFTDKQWTLPAEIHVNLKEIESDLRKRLNSMSFLDKLAGLDHQIDELVNEVRSNPSVAKCDSILKLIEELQSYLSEAQIKRYPLPDIHNRDVSKTISSVVALKKVALARDELYQKIKSTDLKISEIERNALSRREHWVEIIRLCQKQQDQLNECRQQRWAFPRIHYPAVASMIDKYVLYIEMDDLDQEISNHQSVSKQDQFDYLSSCSRQNRNILQCQGKGWRTPALKTANPGEIVERTNQERKRREKEIQEFRERAASLDKRIDVIYQSKCSVPTISTCDKIDDLITELIGVFQLAIQKGIQLDGVKNIRQQNGSSSLQIVREDDFIALRKQAELREQLLSQLQDKSQMLTEIASNPLITPELCSSVIQLCQEYVDLFNKLKRNGWENSGSQNTDVIAIQSRFQTYQSMFELDSSISDQIRKINQNTTGEINYEPIIKQLTEQESLIDQCRQNQWALPKLVVSNLASKRRDYKAEAKHQLQTKEELKRQQEKKEAKAATFKRIKRGLVLTAIGAVAVVCLIFGGILLSRRGKIAFPFSPDYAHGSDYETIQAELNRLGFTDIKTDPDYSGWQKDNTIIEMKIDDNVDFEQGKYYKSDAKIIIRYSSKNRVNVSSILNSFDSCNYKAVQTKLKSAGFTNITLKDEDVFSKDKDHKVAGVLLNGENYHGEEWFVPTTTPIIITYYSYKIKIDSDEKSFIGQDYLKVTEKLEKAGFTNVQVQGVTDGWLKNNSVVSLLVNNSSEFNEDTSYTPDTKILIKYSVGDRIDVTDLVDNWNSVEAKALRESFEQNGFKDISIQDETTNKIKENHLVAEILFNDNSFDFGECYIPQNTKIVIKRYILKIKPGKTASEYEDSNYHDVVKALQNRGFTNIHVLRADDLIMNEDKDCKVKSITINGKSNFSATDQFTFSDKIEIIVHTYPYPWINYDITEKVP